MTKRLKFLVVLCFFGMLIPIGIHMCFERELARINAQEWVVDLEPKRQALLRLQEEVESISNENASIKEYNLNASEMYDEIMKHIPTWKEFQQDMEAIRVVGDSIPEDKPNVAMESMEEQEVSLEVEVSRGSSIFTPSIQVTGTITNYNRDLTETEISLMEELSITPYEVLVVATGEYGLIIEEIEQLLEHYYVEYLSSNIEVSNESGAIESGNIGTLQLKFVVYCK